MADVNAGLGTSNTIKLNAERDIIQIHSICIYELFRTFWNCIRLNGVINFFLNSLLRNLLTDNAFF